MSDTDTCTCGHHRAHHVQTCKAMRQVGVGSTPPGFQPRMERCPCPGFVMWKTAEDRQVARDMNREAGAVNLGAITATFLICLVGTVLFLLSVMGGRHVMCSTHGNALSYCEQATR